MDAPVPADAGTQLRPAKRRTVRWVTLAVAAVVLVPGVVVLASRLGKDPTIVPSPLVGQSAPEFDFVKLDGGEIRSADLKGRPYVLNFWATWCPPCLREHPDLADFHRKWSPKGVELLGVVFQDTAQNARSWQHDRGGDWPVVTDPDNAAVEFGVVRPPETYVVDSHGRVAVKISGPIGRGGLDRIMERVLAAG